jgi:hypothetical protein
MEITILSIERLNLIDNHCPLLKNYLARVLSALYLKSRYHQLPLRYEDRVKATFWGVDDDGRNMLSIGSYYLLA